MDENGSLESDQKFPWWRHNTLIEEKRFKELETMARVYEHKNTV